MQQAILSFPLHSNYSLRDFIVSACNEAGYDWIARWPDWRFGNITAQALYLSGPEGSGKTHLSHIWAEKSHAVALPHSAIEEALSQEAPCCWILDKPEQADPVLLMHLLNSLARTSSHLLLTSRHTIAQLPFTLPDLTSRLKALPSVTIEAPDDTLLRLLLVKRLSDRQLHVTDSVIDYILNRMERSFPGVEKLVDGLDALSLERKTPISTSLAREYFEKQQTISGLFS